MTMARVREWIAAAHVVVVHVKAPSLTSHIAPFAAPEAPVELRAYASACVAEATLPWRGCAVVSDRAHCDVIDHKCCQTPPLLPSSPQLTGASITGS
jgi:hypothetical protein